MSTTAEPAQAAPIGEPAPAPEAPEIPQEQSAAPETPGAASAAPEGEQPPNNATPSNGTGKSVEDLLTSGSQRDLMAALRNPETLQTGGENPGEETPAPGTQGEQPAPPAPVNPPAQEDERRPERIRIGTFAEKDQDFLLSQTQLARSENITMAEAARRLLGQQPPAQAAPAPGEQVPVPEAKPTPLELQRAKVADLKEQLTEATRAFDTDRQAELQISLAEEVAEQKLMEREQAQAVQTQETSAATEWQAAESKEFSAMEAVYPDFQKQGTPLNKAVTQEIARLEKANGAFFNQPDWIRFIVQSKAAELGIMPATRPAAPASPAPVAPPPPAKVAPRQVGHPAALPPAPGQAGAGQPGADPVPALVNSNDLKAQLAYLREHGTRAS